MKIEKLDNQGRGITYYNGLIMFVDNALVDEDVEVEDIVLKKKHYEAKASVIENESVNRVIPKCPFYEACGGCNIMHMNLDHQEAFKLNKVKNILKKYAGISTNIKLVKNDKQILYRNKISMKICNGNWGYYSSKSHNDVVIDNCLLVSKEINAIIGNHEFLNVNNGEIVIRSNYQNEILIAITSPENVSIIDSKIPSNVKGIVVNDKTIYKDNYFYDEIGGLIFKVSYNSFFQVNNYMAGKIFEILVNNLSGENLLDLYCGVGTLGLAVAKQFKNIYGIEKIKNAIEDAKENAIKNNVINAHYYAGDTATILNTLNTHFDTIIVDPPRSGLNEETIKQILELKPMNIAYVSCDPMTLARDLKILAEQYKIIKINALDMFPNTYHVETICILERRK